MLPKETDAIQITRLHLRLSGNNTSFAECPNFPGLKHLELQKAAELHGLEDLIEGSTLEHFVFEHHGGSNEVLQALFEKVYGTQQDGSTYRARLFEKTKRLFEDPDTLVRYVDLSRKGATEDELKALKTLIPLPFDDELLDFYREINGFSLAWLGLNGLDEYFRTSTLYSVHAREGFHCIGIPEASKIYSACINASIKDVGIDGFYFGAEAWEHERPYPKDLHCCAWDEFIHEEGRVLVFEQDDQDIWRMFVSVEEDQGCELRSDCVPFSEWFENVIHRNNEVKIY